MAPSSNKPRSIARRPSSSAGDVSAFVGAAADAPEPVQESPKRAKKIQTPLTIAPALKDELDTHLDRMGTGMSRSTWICEAIREKLNRDR